MNCKILFAACAACLIVGTTPANATEIFDQSIFVDSTSELTVITFDDLEPGNGLPLEDAYVDQGVNIVHRDGGYMNLVQNLVPGGFCCNFVTEANVNSFPNVLSSSIQVTSASPGPSDNFDFILEPMVSAAGLYIGNLGNCGVTQATSVQFLDDQGQIIEEELLTQNHPNIIFGDAIDSACGGQTPVRFDNRIFYGITTDSRSIRTIRVINGINDGDGITIDDVQFGNTAESLSCTGFEPPLASGPVKVKGNRALPLKAQILHEDGYAMTDTDISAPPVLQVWYEYGTTEDPLPIEALPAGQGDEGNQFVFTDDFKWQFNLKTANYTSPGSYTVLMESGDDTEYVLDPTCVAEFVVK